MDLEFKSVRCLGWLLRKGVETQPCFNVFLSKWGMYAVMIRWRIYWRPQWGPVFDRFTVYLYNLHARLVLFLSLSNCFHTAVFFIFLTARQHLPFQIPILHGFKQWTLGKVNPVCTVPCFGCLVTALCQSLLLSGRLCTNLAIIFVLLTLKSVHCVCCLFIQCGQTLPLRSLCPRDILQEYTGAVLQCLISAYRLVLQTHICRDVY